MKQALAAAGYFPADPTRLEEPLIDGDVRAGLARLQRDKGLKVDAWLAPGGATDRALAEAAGQGGVKRRKEGSVAPGSPLEQSLMAIEETFRRYAELGRKRGWVEAADLLDRYLDGTEEPVVLEPDTVLSWPGVERAVATNRELFEAITFDPNGPDKRDLEQQIAETIMALEDGESVTVSTHWDRPTSSVTTSVSMYLDAVNAERTISPDEADQYFGVGRADVRSTIEFELRRDGHRIYGDGTVTHGLEDTYDFNADDPLTIGPRSLADHLAPSETVSRAYILRSTAPLAPTTRRVWSTSMPPTSNEPLRKGRTMPRRSRLRIRGELSVFGEDSASFGTGCASIDHLSGPCS